MNRRKFVKSSAIGGLAASGAVGLPQVFAADGRDYFELRHYEFETREQAAAFESFLKETGVPVLRSPRRRRSGCSRPWSSSRSRASRHSS